MLKKLLTVFVFFTFAITAISAVKSPFNDLSYTQRGILTMGENSMAVTAIVKVFADGSCALQFETYKTAIAKIKLAKNGKVKLCQGGVFGDYIAQNFVLSAFQAILLHKYYRAYFDKDMRISKITARGLEIDFKEYAKEIPRLVTIRGSRYTLQLELVSSRPLQKTK